jgi:hypothetical protein
LRRALKLAFLALTLGIGTAKADPLRIAVISDMNGSYGSADYGPAVRGAVGVILAGRPDLVISTGDMIAGQRGSPKLTTPELERMWSAFHATVSDPLASAGLPFLVTPGNHDASAYPGFEAERAAFAAAFADRKPDLTLIDGEGWPFRVAVSYAGVLMVGLDATTSGPLAAEDMAWLGQILDRHAASHRTVVLFGHLPLMPISQGREKDVLQDPALFALARSAGVDLWLSGHQHAFYSGAAGGILFVAQGALGNGPRKLIGEAATSPQTLTWIEISETGGITVTGLAAPDFAAPIPEEALPPTLGTGDFMLTRQLARPD